MEELSAYFGLGGAAVVFALVEALKRLLALEDTIWMRVVPSASIVLGIGWTALIATTGAVGSQSIPIIVVMGTLSGLAASGLFSGSKATGGK